MQRSVEVPYFGDPDRSPLIPMAEQDSTPAPLDAAPSRQRMEFDLRDIREAYHVPLETVEKETRMPPDILRRFEAGKLVGDDHYNEVYLKNLLKSYSEALGISHQEVVSAFEATKSGGYDGSLRRLYLEGEAPDIETAITGKGPAPAVAALAGKPSKPRAEPEPELMRPNEHFPKKRVQSAKAAASTAKPIEKSWGLIIAGTVVGVVAIGAILWYLFRGTEPEPEPVERPVAVDTTTATDTASVAAAQPQSDIPPAPQFTTPIVVTVVATDEPLEDFKMQVDDDARRPYWLNPGTEQTFEGSQQVIVWGEGGEGNYDNAKLRLQGLEWSPREGQIYRINQQRGQALLDSLHRAQFNGAG